jgi:hypothetical protein
MRDNHFSAFSALEAMNNFRAINRDTGFLLSPRHHVSWKQRFAAAPQIAASLGNADAEDGTSA